MDGVATGVMTGVALYSPYKEFPEQLWFRLQPPVKVRSADRPSPGVMKMYEVVHGIHTVSFSLMTPEAVAAHLQGFVGFIGQIYKGSPDRRGLEILEQLKKSKTVVGVTIRPEKDPAGGLGLVSTVAELIKAVQFVNGTLLDYHDKVILAPDGKYDRHAMIDPLAGEKKWWKMW